MEKHNSCRGCIYQYDCADDDHDDWGGCKDWTDSERSRFNSSEEKES